MARLGIKPYIKPVLSLRSCTSCLQCQLKQNLLPVSLREGSHRQSSVRKYTALSGLLRSEVLPGFLLRSWRQGCRFYSVQHQVRHPRHMSAWEIHHYGGIEEFTRTDTALIPVIKSPQDVLVEVHAASINPIDIMMLGGYGSRSLNTLRQLACRLDQGREFPLVLGRDFSGVVIDTGKAVTGFKPGDKVWGAGDASKPGTFAQCTLVNSNEISLKPQTLSHVEAASLPYVAATTWSALSTVGRLNAHNVRDKRVLVLGGAGGLGTFAIQLLKAWRGHVTTTCATDAVEKVLELGADVALDYRTYDVRQELEQVAKFDVILDTVGGDSGQYGLDLLKPQPSSKYITIVTPVLQNNDDLGMALGMAKSALTLGLDVARGLQGGGRGYRWALFMPNGTAMTEVARLVDGGKIQPVVERVFPFHSLPEACAKVAAKHNRGKTVVEVMGDFPLEDAGTEAPTGGQHAY